MQSRIEDDRWMRDTEDVVLHSTKGRVRAPRRFAEQHLGLLAPEEAALVREELEVLAAEPIGFDRPLLRTERFADGERQVPARRGGARSAYLLADEVKIKACRPEDLLFPHWELDEDLVLRVEQIPFGVMTAEGVMREILAHCFEHRHGLESAGRPWAVFEYAPAGNGILGYALASHVPGDERIERFFDCGGLTLHDLVRLQRRGRLAGEEIQLQGICRDQFVAAKAALLATFNFGGGFRGLLNSNIGNDVIRAGRLCSLCDFDTFRRLPLPPAADRDGIRRFTLRAFLELIKSSLPLLDYLELDGAPREEIHRALAACYRGKSTLYRAYARLYRDRAADLGWDPELVARSMDEAFATPVSFELLQELIPNSLTAREVQLAGRTTYVPHN